MVLGLHALCLWIFSTFCPQFVHVSWLGLRVFNTTLQYIYLYWVHLLTNLILLYWQFQWNIVNLLEFIYFKTELNWFVFALAESCLSKQCRKGGLFLCLGIGLEILPLLNTLTIYLLGVMAWLTLASRLAITVCVIDNRPSGKVFYHYGLGHWSLNIPTVDVVN